MARIAIVSNYDKEMYDETFLNVPSMTQEKAQEMCKGLNTINPDGEDYYRVVPNDYQLKKFEI